VGRQAFVAFQGGGALGMAHLGAWLELSREFDLIGTAGTSAGAIVAALCAVRYTPEHAIDLFADMEWPEYVRRRGMFEFLRNLDGWSDGEKFYQWLRQRMGVYLKGAPATVTFSSLNQATGGYLAIVATDLNDRTGRPVVFDKESEPDTDISFAVRASMSIPGVFAPVPRRDRAQMLVDGGVILNFPGELLLPMAASKGTPLIGVRFDRPQPQLQHPRIWSILRRTLDAGSQPGNVVPQRLTAYPHYIDIAIDVAEFDSLNFNLTSVEKERLLRRGADAAKVALAEYNGRVSSQSLSASRPEPPEPITPIEGELRQVNQELTTATVRSAALTITKTNGVVLTGATLRGSAERLSNPPTLATFVRGRTALGLWIAVMMIWVYVNPGVLDADFPTFAFGFAGLALAIATVFARPRTFRRLKIVPLARPTRLLLIAASGAMLILWALGYRLMSTRTDTARLELFAVLHAEQSTQPPTTTRFDVAERSSVAPRNQGLAVCVGASGILSGADFVLIATGGLTMQEQGLMDKCTSVSNLIAGVRSSQVMFRRTLPRRGVARGQFTYGDESFDITLEVQPYALSPDVVHVSIVRKPLPVPPPPPQPQPPYCVVIVFERIAAGDVNSRNRKAFEIRFRDGTTTNDYKTELADSRLRYPSAVIVKEIPRKPFGVTVSFKFFDTDPRATLQSRIDLSSNATRFRAAIDFDRGMKIEPLSNEDYVSFLGTHQLETPNCEIAPKGLSWK